jgi:hypothetical protein
MNDRKYLPVKPRGANTVPVHANDILTHPFANLESGQNRDRWRYAFLRVTKPPRIDRLDSGRILVQNTVTGKRTEHYALLFGVSFREV